MFFSTSKIKSPSSIKARIGSINGSQGHLLAIKEIILHPGYKCEKYDNDIALLELEKPSSAKFCTLPEQSQGLAENTSVTVMGWGWSNEDMFEGHRPDTLQKAQVNVISNKRCQDWYAESSKKNIIMDSQACAGFEKGGIDACFLDSGSPLIDPASGTLVGIVSTGVGCARPRLPGIYSRVSYFSDWINEVIR